MVRKKRKKSEHKSFRVGVGIPRVGGGGLEYDQEKVEEKEDFKEKLEEEKSSE